MGSSMAQCDTGTVPCRIYKLNLLFYGDVLRWDHSIQTEEDLDPRISAGAEDSALSIPAEGPRISLKKELDPRSLKEARPDPRSSTEALLHLRIRTEADSDRRIS